MVWGGHASRAMVAALLAVHAAALIWLCGDSTRLRLIGYDFKEVTSEAFVNSPPDKLRAIGYTEDDPSDLQAFRAIAEPIVAGSATDGERLRRFGSYIYGLRRADAPDVHAPRFERLSVVWSALQRGEHGDCGEMSPILAAFWRSLGGHARAVRWATSDGVIGHDAVELYSQAHGKWIYYDMNLNGYGEDEGRTPQSLAALRSHLLTNEDVHLVADTRLHDWDAAEFAAALRDYPVEWYALNNRSLYFENDRRFGPLNRWAWLLGHLPSPLDRVMDNVAGDRDRQLVIEGKIEIAGLFTFDGARWLFAYLVVATLIGGATLAGPAVSVVAGRRRARFMPAATRRSPPGVRRWCG